MTNEQRAALDLAILNLKTHGDDQLLTAIKPLLDFYESRRAAGASEGQAEPDAWAVYWGLGPMRPNSVHFERATAAKVASEIKSNTEIRPLFAHPSAEIAGLRKERDELMKALADCREACPVPESGSKAEVLWAGAIGNPGDVPGYVAASIAALRERIAGMEKDARNARLEALADAIGEFSFGRTMPEVKMAIHALYQAEKQK